MNSEETVSLLQHGIEQHGIAPEGEKRTVRSSRTGDSGKVSLLESDGILHWDLDKQRVTRGRPTRLQTYRFEDLSPNKVSQKLHELDEWLTPGQGLREIASGEVCDPALPVSRGRILLFIHGTFSNCESLVGNLSGSEAGRSYLATAREEYDQILALRRGYACAESLQQRLHMQAKKYHYVISNFESEDPGWAFWKYFRGPKGRIADAVTNAVFDGPNDLVVDTASMTDLSDEFGLLDRDRQVLDFQTTDRIHHCNYFQQEATIDFIQKSLGQS